MDIKRIIGTFCTIYPPNKRNTKWMKNAVVSKFLRCPILKVLSQMILLLLPCKTRWCHLTVVSKHKKLVSRYQKLHSFNKISESSLHVQRLQWLSKTATNSVNPSTWNAGINNFAFPRTCVKPCMLNR